MNYKFWGLLFLLKILSPGLLAGPMDLVSKSINRTYDRARSINGPVQLCSSSPKGSAQQTVSLEKTPKFSCKTVASLPKQQVKLESGQVEEISVIKEQDVVRLRNCYPSASYLDIYDHDVCAQRSHILSQYLEANFNINTGKIFLKPERRAWGLLSGTISPDDKAVAHVGPPGQRKTISGSQIKWDYHVASFIYVQPKDDPTGPPKLYVLDPFLQQDPIPYEKWKGRLAKDSRYTEMLGSRFHFEPGQANEVRSDYNQQELRRSFEIMGGQPKYVDELSTGI